MVTYDVEIKFTDGSKILLQKVSDYEVDNSDKCVSVMINGYRQFFNFDHIIYIGRVFDLYGNA